MSIQRNRPANDVGSSTEPVLPERVRDHRSTRRGATAIFFGQERPAANKPCAKHVKIVARYDLAVNGFGLLTRVECKHDRSKRGCVSEHAAIAPIRIGGKGECS